MNPLRASWLGSWKAPWGLERGRRWRDPAWALAAIAQAWMLGGKTGRWPRGFWEAKCPVGPRLSSVPTGFDSAPDPAWVSLLRHGSPKVSPDLRGPRESDLVCSCWNALLKGDGAPWMALGTVLFDRRARTRWIPVFGAVDSSGALYLPPFLEHLVPSWMHRLPDGWWDYLLSHTDPSGILHPAGPPPQDLPWDLLDPKERACLDPLVLEEPPRALSRPQLARWAIHLGERTWMLDPRLRAWGRGLGLCPAAMEPLVPASLAMGDLPVQRLEPSSTPETTTGYPDPGTAVHPCADPFHWLGEGRRAMQKRDAQKALQAFAWSHAHFARLQDRFWARRVASEAIKAAISWGDMDAAVTWRRIRGPLEASDLELEEAVLAGSQGEWDRSIALARKRVEEHPECSESWLLITRRGLLTDQADWLRESLPRIKHDGLSWVVNDWLNPSPVPTPVELDPESRLLGAFQRAKSGQMNPREFWNAWAQCMDQPLRLEVGLLLLEGVPDQRTPARLLELKALADRNGSPAYRTRLDALWPTLESEPVPERILDAWLDQRKQPTWLYWGSADRPCTAGKGPRPPEALLDVLLTKGNVGPMDIEGTLWWGHSLFWEGSPVGRLLTVIDGQEAVAVQASDQLIAPWLARLMPASAPEAWTDLGPLLTDGSEPMASVLQELVRVSTSTLPVLIHGPTGSGKELAAREIHERSGRRGPFIPISCSEYVETLMESELFGHTKGAFTGADRDRKGAIEQAEGGTLFLDEVADLSTKLQSLFLRVLQEKEVRRVGSDKTHKVNVRFVSATHRSLDQLVESGHFRRDLHYRLKGVVLTLPSLLDRRHEFPYLVPRLTARVAKEAGMESPELAPGLPLALARHSWPGNFRELRHAIERALLRCDGGTLKATHFPELETAPAKERGWNEATRNFQRQFILNALRRHRFQITETAKTLGITRVALYTAVRRLGLDLALERQRWAAEGGP